MKPITELVEGLGDQMSLDVEAAVLDVEEQRKMDARGAAGDPRPPTLEYVETRVAAVRGAAENRELYALRQSLIDLAAVSVELAATLPRPRIPLRQGS